MFKGIIYRLKNLWKKPFKVGVISPQYPERKISNQGIAIHVDSLTYYLSKLGVEIHIFTIGSKNSIKKEYIGEGKRIIHRIKLDEDSHKDIVIEKKIARSLFDAKVVGEIIKENESGKFDILHSHMGISGVLLSKYSQDIKLVHTVHSLGKNMIKFMSKEERKYYNLTNWMESAMVYSNAIIAVSKTSRGEILSNYPINPKKVFYIPNGVDRSIFHPDNTIAEEKKITCIGRFSKEKGVDLIPKIASKILSKNKEIKFTAVFPPDNSMPETLVKIKHQFETLEKTFPKRFIWIKEPLGREELAKLYNESMIYIQPSRYEAFGMTVLEAMACGKAVICSNKGGLPEVVGNAGLIIKFNSNIFAREILKLINSPKLRRKLGLRGIKKTKLFDWERIAKETLELYQVLAKKKPEEEQERIAQGFKLLAESTCQKINFKKRKKTSSGIENIEKTPEISVIIPVFNAKKFIKESINSVLKQTFQDIELIIVDDASTDNSLQIIKKMSQQNNKIKILVQGQNKGKAGTINSGLKEARGNYIAFLDADDLMDKTKLDEQIKVFKQNPNIDMTYTDLKNFDEQGEKGICESVDFKSLEEPLKKLQASAKSKRKFKYPSHALDKEKFIPGGSVMVKKKIINSGIKFDEELKNSEDCDFNFQVIGAGYKIKRIPKPLYLYRQHQGQKSRDKEEMQIAKEYIIKKLRSEKYFTN